MTTGRINQVTIFERPSPEYMGPARSTRGSELVHRRGCGTPGRTPGPESNRRQSTAAIHLPPLNSPGRGPQKPPFPRRFGIPSPEGGYPPPVTSKDGYQYAGVPPNPSIYRWPSANNPQNPSAQHSLKRPSRLRAPHFTPAQGQRANATASGKGQ
jgi:hypothetical protein